MGDRTHATFGEVDFAPRPFALRDGRTCLIRATTDDDAARLCALLPQTHQESDYLAWLPGEFQMTVEEERQFIRSERQLGSVLICAEVDGRIIAVAGSRKLKFRRYQHQAELGITVLREYWGQGIGRQLTQCLLDTGRKAGLRKITLRVFADNQRAMQLYRALGFVEEGRIKEDALRRDGTLSDTILMAHFLERDHFPSRVSE